MALSSRMLALAGAILLGALSPSLAQTDPGATDSLYYYYQDGVQTGPVALTALRELAFSGQLSAEALVWTRGQDDWIRADQAAGLSGEFVPALPEQAIYYVADHGVRLGPLTLSDLGARITAGQIGPRDLVWTIGTEGWIEVAQMEILQPFVPPEPPLTPDEQPIEPEQRQASPLESLQVIIGTLFDEEFPNAEIALRAEFTACVISAVKPLGRDIYQRLIETQFNLSEAERAQLEAEHPGLAGRVNGCSDIVSGATG